MGERCRVVWAVVTATGLTAGCSSDPPPGGGDGPAATRALSGRDKGAKEAADAVAAGVLRLKEYPPLPYPPGHQAYVALLQERCGVGYEVPRLPAGVAEADFVEEVRGWNEVMEAAVKQKHGVGIFDELHEEARRRWQEQLNPGDTR